MKEGKGANAAENIPASVGSNVKPIQLRPRVRLAVLVPYGLILILVSVWLVFDGPLRSSYYLSDVGESLSLELKPDAFADISNNDDEAELSVRPLTRDELEAAIPGDWCDAINDSLNVPAKSKMFPSVSFNKNNTVCIWSSNFATVTFTIDTSKSKSPSSRMTNTAAVPTSFIADGFKALADCSSAEYRDSLSSAKAWHVDNDFSLFNFAETCAYEIPDENGDERNAGQVLAVAGFTTGQADGGGWESGSEEWGYGMFASVSTPVDTIEPETGAACCDQDYVVGALGKFLSNALPAFYGAVPPASEGN